ncbi:protein SCO1/2 [Roseivirga ehrenbergii]|uniref:Electron transporter n=1 Tax=Roseivirga ehrenbergii (strain DSM 102268 / JCM 13514 / KCTC 12282 / NCIMB 14502 / KMM 6017) TaxID=279360 RepID=A0A150X6S4_ROSEK|nr:SCO family protein [Roseivirga ehrenbergii]KYG74411.1 electron transporter [Roseivirga ehrenbergii]TCL14287.1 protein SCO1/2 [Roseivirga ehrenbergii]
MKQEHLALYLINLSLLFLFGCTNQNTETEGTPLPFYNSADFTPEWIGEEEVQYSEIHTIANFSFQNQSGEVINNKSLAGKIYVADFFFTICPSICPKMTSNLEKVQTEFINDKSVMLVSHSVMPWVDSVSVLKTYAEMHGIENRKWHLLTGHTEEIYQLARQSYFAEKEIGLDKDSNEFLHTENFILVDGLGRIRGVYNGTIPLEMDRLITDIKTLKQLG